MAWRVVDDTLAKKMYDRIVSLEGNIRPNTFILPNYPSYDDMELDPPYTGQSCMYHIGNYCIAITGIRMCSP